MMIFIVGCCALGGMITAIVGLALVWLSLAIWLPIFLSGSAIVGISLCMILPLSIWITHASTARMKDAINVEFIKYLDKLPIRTIWRLKSIALDVPLDDESGRNYHTGYFVSRIIFTP
jgi:hypothetical protein